MLTSMTGFGRASEKTSLGFLTVEMQSVNRKYLELNIALPKALGFFESEIRKMVLGEVSRGQIQIRISLELSAEIGGSCIPNAQLLHSMKQSWEALAKQLGFAESSITLPFLMEYLPDCEYGWKAGEQDWVILKKVIAHALQDFNHARIKEGKSLASDLTSRVQTLRQLLAQVEQLSKGSIEKFKERLTEKVKVFQEPKEALYKEIVQLADRLDITEEVVRLKSHFTYMEELLSDPEGKTGRKMDFLVQEMGRETNTAGAKSADASIARLIVEMKSELEKIKEQVQNLE